MIAGRAGSSRVGSGRIESGRVTRKKIWMFLHGFTLDLLV